MVLHHCGINSWCRSTIKLNGAHGAHPLLQLLLLCVACLTWDAVRVDERAYACDGVLLRLSLQHLQVQQHFVPFLHVLKLRHQLICHLPKCSHGMLWSDAASSGAY